ncbi:class I SAM-dependent methyltransferase [Pseudodesulfovibrio sp.]|uniref:class I SAM-dependent methyltransferase n=1 Tax=unclassified Pseudodesulfovibrio TaxID=2661612 RepID=UPI003AFF82CE
MSNNDNDIQAEAQAFDSRIDQRVAAGFVPDLRRAVKCEYFYKSFWRDPLFIKLYLGWIMDGFLDLLDTHCGKGLRILDVGCGAGYMSLELARNGHHVEALDISASCIGHARQVLEENPYTEGFGSLNYSVLAFEDMQKAMADKTFDVILFSVSMHHMMDVQAVVDVCHAMLPDKGHLVFYEPCHERFRVQDAAQVALIRGLLALTGYWYDPEDILPHLKDDKALAAYFEDTHYEYVMERDKNEPGGQSPHDLEANGEEILSAARSRFREIETRPGCSFIYRLLGGLRGDEEKVKQLAEFITLYERVCVNNGFIKENMFYFVGQKDA